MIIPSLQFLIILLLWPETASAQATALLQNCTSKCGDVTIPFPFGIGYDCSIDNWFAIECKRNKPYLRNIDLEVLDISLDGTMRVSYSVYNTCDQNKSLENTAYLESTPFIFSQTRNKFIGVGCGKFFFMSYDDSPIAQCTTTNICGLEQCENFIGGYNCYSSPTQTRPLSKRNIFFAVLE